jgi:hypothetical protein
MASPVYTAEDAAYWYAPLVRAVPAAALACVITFAGGFYTPDYGLGSFGGFAIVAGLVGIFLSIRALGAGATRTLFLLQGIVSVVAGFLELVAGIRVRGRRAVARDWIFVGALTVLLAVVALVIPPDYSQHYFAKGDGGSRVLNTSVMIVGALGVYGAISAVYLAIAGFSLRFARNATPDAATTDAAVVEEKPQS